MTQRSLYRIGRASANGPAAPFVAGAPGGAYFASGYWLLTHPSKPSSSTT